MQSEYVVVRTHWTGSRYSARDAGAKELYAIRSGSKSAKFFPPGSDTPRFETRGTSFFSMEVAFVETSVDYTFGYLKPLNSKSGDLELLNVARSSIGVLKAGLTKEAVNQVSEPISLRKKLKFAAMKESLAKLAEAARYRELLVEGKPVVRFQLAKDSKSVTARVLSQYIKDVDERVVLILAHRCFALQQAQSGG